MKPNLVCIVLAVAGLSFGIGQSVGQDASADPKASRVQFVRDTAVRSELTRIRFELSQTGLNIRNLCQALAKPAGESCYPF